MDNIKATEQISNAILENIYQRRSVRNYSDKEVSDEIIKEIIRAGTYAPSAVNKQPWRFVVVKNRQLIDKYDDLARKAFLSVYGDTDNPDLIGYVQYLSKPTTRILYGAPVFILVFAAPDVIDDRDCALAAENMMLAARSLGIGSCWIGLAAGLGSDTEFLKEVGVPEGYKLIAPLIFGYPAKDNQKAPARNADVILKWVD
ncbi:TPA: nitroreductase family protein [Methanosarcina acetivorans]|nr:nitroreductase [Methanosarcina acetivorans]HIH95057.1 nitroreductase family protein [Methanosarcina acetivorans]